MNWERWGIGCIIGIGLFGLYGIVEFFYNKKHGPPMTSANHDITEDVWGGHEGDAGGLGDGQPGTGSKDIEAGALGREVGEGCTSKADDCKVGGWVAAGAGAGAGLGTGLGHMRHSCCLG